MKTKFVPFETQRRALYAYTSGETFTLPVVGYIVEQGDPWGGEKSTTTAAVMEDDGSVHRCDQVDQCEFWRILGEEDPG